MSYDDAYALDDPKHPTYVDRYSALADDERKRKREVAVEERLYVRVEGQPLPSVARELEGDR